MNKILRNIIFSFAIVLIGGCIEDSVLKIDFNIEPSQLDDGWIISTPEDEGLNENVVREVYDQFFSENDYVTGISLLVIKNGKLVTEGYCRDMKDRYVKRNLQSATKSITSLVFGAAKDMGYFDNLDQKLYDIIPEAFDSDIRKRDITLRHLMTMNSGLEFDNEDFAEELHIKSKKNQMKFLLSRPLFADPGTTYWYRDCDPQLLGGAILKKTGLTLEEIADDRLFKPMGISDYYWEKNIDGHNWAAQALFMTPRDFAKIGLLVLNKGNWNGQQLVTEEWILQSTSYQTEFDYPFDDLSSVIVPDYGFYWWLYEKEKNFSNIPNVRTIAARGAGGQLILIVPEKELLIVMTSEPYVDGEFDLDPSLFYLAGKIINSTIE